MPFVELIDPRGKRVEIPEQHAAAAMAEGFTREDPQARRARLLEKEYGGAAGEALAAAAGAGRGLTFGLSDMALTRTGLVEPETLAGLREANPIASGVGQAAGIAGSMLVPGGALVGAGKAAGALRGATAGVRALSSGASALGARAGAMVGGRGLASRALAKGVEAGTAGAVEGAVFGAAETVTQVALNEVDLGSPQEVGEKLISNIGIGAVLGGAGSALLAGGGTAMAGLAGKALERMPLPSVEESARKWAVRGLHSTQDPMRKLEVKGMTDEVGKNLLAKHAVLGDEQILSRSGSVKETLGRIQTVKEDAGKRIGQSLKDLDAAAGGPTVDGATIARKIDEELLAPILDQPLYDAERKILAEASEQFEAMGMTNIVKANNVKTNVQAKIEKLFDKEIDSPANKFRKKIAGLVRQEVDDSAEAAAISGGNLKLFDDFVEAKRTFASMAEAEKLAKHGVARIGGNRNISLTDYIAGAAFGAGFGGPAMFVAPLANKVARERGSIWAAQGLKKLSDLMKASRDTDTRIGSAVSNFLRAREGLAEVGKRRIVAPASVGALMGSGLLGRPSKAASRKEALKERAEEIADLVADPERLATVVSNRLAVLEDIAPTVSSQMATTAARGLQFLSRKVPQKPQNPNDLQPHLDDWQPTEAELGKFERYLKAVSNPMTVLEDLEAGMLAPESAEALREVYPALFDAIGTKVAEELSEMPTRVPYSKRLQLGLLLDRPTDATMDPAFVKRSQEVFAEKPRQGQGGGGIRLQGLDNLKLAESTMTKWQKAAV